jgi:hypothetical protein
MLEKRFHLHKLGLGKWRECNPFLLGAAAFSALSLAL